MGSCHYALLVTVYGDVPRPRVLFEDVPDEVFESMKDLVPTYQRVAYDERVHNSDWDLLVTFAPHVTARRDSFHVLSFGATTTSPFYDPGGQYNPAKRISRKTSTGARTVHVPEDLAKPIRRLLGRSVAENVQPNGYKSVWSTATALDARRVMDDLTPWVTLGVEQAVLAFQWQPNARHGLWWVLPDETTEHREWLRLMLKVLQGFASDRFPADPDWRRDPEWAPTTLLDALEALEQVELQREEAIAEFDARETDANLKIDAELNRAAENEHVLLTGTDEPLVDQVAEAFRAIGFDVEKMDAKHVDKNGAALEDLRLTRPEEEKWVCLVEVKGLTGGPKSRDIGQVVGRPARQFILDEKREPEKVALVVNQFRNVSPGARPVPPVDRPERDLAPLEELEGVFIDTRDLFRALQAIAADPELRTVVQSSIVNTKGVWSWPPEASPAAEV